MAGEGADDLVVVGPTSLPVPCKLCDRIWDNQFVNMQELLPARLGAPDPSWKDLIEAVSKGKSTNMGKTIKSIEQWVARYETPRTSHRLISLLLKNCRGK